MSAFRILPNDTRLLVRKALVYCFARRQNESRRSSAWGLRAGMDSSVDGWADLSPEGTGDNSPAL